MHSKDWAFPFLGPFSMRDTYLVVVAVSMQFVCTNNNGVKSYLKYLFNNNMQLCLQKMSIQTCKNIIICIADAWKYECSFRHFATPLWKWLVFKLLGCFSSLFSESYLFSNFLKRIFLQILFSFWLLHFLAASYSQMVGLH